MGRIKTELIVNDFHVPYHDQHVLENILFPLVQDMKPDGITFPGDVFDCYALSHFDKNARRLDSFQDELDIGIEMLAGFRDRSPRCKRKVLSGNHEERLAKQLMRHPQFGRLRALDWSSLVSKKDTGFEFIDKAAIRVEDWVIGHGDVARMHSGASARCMYQKWGTKLFIGHCHRMGSFSATNMRGIDRAVENGHVCDPKQLDYTGVDKGKIQNWQPGFSILYHKPGWSQLQQIHINDGQCIVEGQVYG